jgi:hypothetical protein
MLSLTNMSIVIDPKFEENVITNQIMMYEESGSRYKELK